MVIPAGVLKALPLAALLLAAPAAAAQPGDILREIRASLVNIPGGRFVMGDPSGEPDEAPRAATVSPFRMMRLEITNRQFEAFAAARHKTDPERSGAGYVWRDRRWRLIPGASWQNPHGPGDSLDADGIDRPDLTALRVAERLADRVRPDHATV